MGSEKRKTLLLKFKQPDLKSLKDISSQMKTIQRESFVHKYGKILNLLAVNVQTGALTALAQYYDPLLRCFTFQDFQLVPTLEEFERILGYSLERGNPYRYTGQPPKLDTIAEVLKIDIRELASTKEEKGAIHGFSRKYLEQKCQDLADKKKWSIFIDVLALIIYGIVIFPNLDNFVDFAAINVFLAFNKHKQNPVPAILADVYYSMHMRHEKKGGTILCCVPVLYTWFVSHMFKKGYHVGVKSNREWAQSIASLTGDKISWYYREQGVEEIICRCGDFPNVPLMGTKGCINYNPMIALRQLGYPMLDKPDDKSLEAFVLHNTGIVDPPMLRRISRAWELIIRKGKILGCRSCSTKEPYQQWVKKRVQEIKLPFHNTASNSQEMPEPILVANEEIEELKASLLKSEEEKKELQARLEKVSQENDNLRSENTCKSQFIERSNKRLKVEKGNKLDIQDCLRGANEELDVRRQERNAAIEEAYMWKQLWTKSASSEKNIKNEFEDLKKQLKEMVDQYENQVRNERQQKEEIEELLSKHQDALKAEMEASSELKNYIDYQEKIYNDLKDETIYWEERFMVLLGQLKNQEIYKELEDKGKHWKDCFSKLAMLANQAIIKIPKHLREIDAVMHPLNTPIKVYKFVEYCKHLVEELEEKIGCPLEKDD